MLRPTIRISEDLHTAIVEGHAIGEGVSFNKMATVLLMEALNNREMAINGYDVFDVATGEMIGL